MKFKLLIELTEEQYCILSRLRRVIPNNAWHNIILHALDIAAHHYKSCEHIQHDASRQQCLTCGITDRESLMRNQ